MITHVQIPAATLEELTGTTVTIRPTVHDVLVTSLTSAVSNFDGGGPDETFVYESDGGGP